jgi:hypothetical protein
MKKFCVLIPKLNQPLSKSLPPIGILHGKKIFNLPLNDHLELKFMMGKGPELLKLIKKAMVMLQFAIKLERLEIFLAHSLTFF